MPRRTANQSINDIIEEAVRGVVERVSRSISRAIARAEADASRRSARVEPRRRAARRSTRPEDQTRWVADKRARRVPKFVIEETGLDTKKKIVARYGEDVVFERGKPLPKPRAEVPASAQSAGPSRTETPKAPVKARGPIIRKAAARAG
jgi:hypothetical protein